MKLSEFNEIYDKYYLMVMKVAFNVLKDYHYAQDVCQEVFILFYAKCDLIEPQFRKPWLLVTTKRKAIDFLRKKYIKREVCDEVTSPDCENWDSLEKDYIRREFGKKVLRELKVKDRQWYEIITRVMIDGESQQKVADDLGISLSNLRIKQHRAKNWLRKNFPPDSYL